MRRIAIRSLNAAALQLVLLAMVLHAFLPPGYMPAPASSGAFITVCTMNGGIRLPLDAAGAPEKSKPRKNGPANRELCPFAAANSHALIVANLDSGVRDVPAALLAAVPFTDGAPVRALIEPYSSRGPPLM